LVALTANATSSDKERSMMAGMNEHLSKPILPDSLAEVLSSVRQKPFA
jgi:CheY-like chemotaxis protein